MGWRFWSKKEEQKDDDPNRMDWEPTGPLNIQDQATDPVGSYWTTTQVAQLVLTLGAAYGVRKGYKRYLRRIPNIGYVKPAMIKSRRSIYGYVARVGDGDNFRVFHTPGGPFMGWGWMPGRKPQDLTKADLVDNTLHVRVAGVDAPECAHFGKPEQPFGREALAWLANTLEGRYVRVLPYSKDRFDRIVSSVQVRLPYRPWRSDLGLRMIQSGCATVYEAKSGAEYGDMEEQYRQAEKQAKARKIGMWKDVGIVGKMLGQTQKVETPRQYKNRMNREESPK